MSAGLPGTDLGGENLGGKPLAAIHTGCPELLGNPRREPVGDDSLMSFVRTVGTLLVLAETGAYWSAVEV